MARYHINPRTGDPGVCKAKHACPYGDLTKDHFDSQEAAREAYEAGKLDEAFNTLRKATDEVLDAHMPADKDSAITSDEAILEGIKKAGWPTMVPIEKDKLMSPDQIAHQVGTMFVSTRKAGSIGARGGVEAIMETMVIDPQGDEVFTLTSRELDEDTQASQHMEAIEWASTNQNVTRFPMEDAILTDETMQEMDAYYTDHPSMMVDVDNSGPKPNYVVYANNEFALATKDKAIADAAQLASSSGVWREVKDSSIEANFQHFSRLVNKGEDWLNDDIQDKEDFLAANKDASDARVKFTQDFLALDRAALKAIEHQKLAPAITDDTPPF